LNLGKHYIRHCLQRTAVPGNIGRTPRINGRDIAERTKSYREA